MANPIAERLEAIPISTVTGLVGVIGIIMAGGGIFTQTPNAVFAGFAIMVLTQLYRAIAIRAGLPY